MSSFFSGVKAAITGKPTKRQTKKGIEKATAKARQFKIMARAKAQSKRK